MSWTRAAAAVAIVVVGARLAGAQVSTEEAARRLRERTSSTQPAATQPVGELARISEENRQLRLRVSQLEMEVSTLRNALAQLQQPGAARTGAPASQPANARAEMPRVPITGAWRGGDINRGSGYLLDFTADGAYHRNFLSYNKREAGQYRFTGPDTIEMWSEGAPEGADHNEYRVAVENGQLTLTPTRLNGRDIVNGKPLVLTRGS